MSISRVIQNSKFFLSPISYTETAFRLGHSRCTRNKCRRPPPKYRGVYRNQGEVVRNGTILVKQMTLKFHPGLNVGVGSDSTLFAMMDGKVYYSCEIFDPDWDHRLVQKNYTGREGQKIYKKYLNIIPQKQHNRFKLIDSV